jgi:hypothetical protein
MQSEMPISQEQLEALDLGQPVPLSVAGRECILLPGSLYEQLRDAVEDWHPVTMRRRFATIMAEDWDDPAMSIYDD